MARFTFNIPDSLQEQLVKCADIDRIAPMMINEATPIVVTSIKRRLEQHRDTGELIKSVKAKKAKKTKYGGYYGRVGFDGYDPNSAPTKDYPKGTPNAVKAMGIEYGSKRGEPKRPFMDAAVNDVEKQVTDKMQEVFNREVGG